MEKDRKERDIKKINLTYRLLLVKMLFRDGTAAFNWHLKSYSGALKRRKVFKNFFLQAWEQKRRNIFDIHYR